ncbi:MAG: cupin domain-containing protein [Bacillota bacterium]
MKGKTYAFKRTDDKAIEKLIDDDPVMINHMVIPPGDEVPEHAANSNVYLVLVRGRMRLALGGEAEDYGAGNIVNVEFCTRMHITNPFEEVLEFFVVKAPSPRVMDSTG